MEWTVRTCCKQTTSSAIQLTCDYLCNTFSVHTILSTSVLSYIFSFRFICLPVRHNRLSFMALLFDLNCLHGQSSETSFPFLSLFNTDYSLLLFPHYRSWQLLLYFLSSRRILNVAEISRSSFDYLDTQMHGHNNAQIHIQ